MRALASSGDDPPSGGQRYRVGLDEQETLRQIHLPVHASRLNQVEIYFSVVQRKVVSPNDFRDLSEVQSRLLDFQQHYEQIATPFEWKLPRTNLNALLERVCRHDRSEDL